MKTIGFTGGRMGLSSLKDNDVVIVEREHGGYGLSVGPSGSDCSHGSFDTATETWEAAEALADGNPIWLWLDSSQIVSATGVEDGDDE